MNKRELEAFTLEFFKEHYANFPTGEVIQDDRPDFTIDNKGKVIGIEIGEVFQDLTESNRGSQLKSIEMRHEKVGQALIKAIREYSDRRFIIDIEFSPLYNFAVSKINDIANDCLPPCLEFIMNNLERTSKNLLPAIRIVHPINIQILRNHCLWMYKVE